MAMAFDAQRQRVVVYGGRSSTATLADQWEWDGTNWTPRLPAGQSPGPRAGSVMAYNTARGALVLFGGIGGLLWSNDVWENDGVQWSNPNPVVRPPAVRNPSMTFDPVAQRTMLYGGDDHGVPNNVVWEWNGVQWQQFASSTTPGHCLSAGLAYDQRRQRVVLHGGKYETETWTWDRAAGTWSAAAYQAPPAINSGVAVSDWAGHTLYVVGYTTFLWDHATQSWLQQTPTSQPGPLSTGLAFDTTRRQGVAFRSLSGSSQTWIWDEATHDWQQRTPSISPPPLSSGAMAYDLGRDRTVLFGGFLNGLPTAETWEWDGTAWSQRFPVHAPPARGAAAMAYDLATAGVVVFGGFNAGGPRNDVWDWDGTDWTQRAMTNPGPSRRASMALCTRGDAVLVVGGNDAVPFGRQFDEVWVMRGNLWEQLPSDPLPATQASVAAAFDLSQGELVVFGGQTSIGVAAGIWVHGVPRAAVMSLGGGCPGSQGMPELTALGLPVTGNAAFAIDAARFVPQQPAMFLAGLATALVQLPGQCRVFVDPLFSSFAILSTGGTARLVLPIPPVATLVGVEMFAQAAALDPTAQVGYSFTPALDMRLGR